MSIKDVLHDVNNQLEIIIDALIAAETDPGGNSHPQSRDRKQVVNPCRSREMPSRTQS